MDYKKLGDILFPKVTTTVAQCFDRYPKRQLKEGAIVTRFAPSPTGFIHIGNLYTSYVSERLAHQSGGVIFLRVEDTDKKREVEGSIEKIIKGLSEFGITFDEGPVGEHGELGEYGPYVQSNRGDIYQAFAKHLVAEGKAYPCFCTEEELGDIRSQQEEKKILPGYHTEYAKCKQLSVDTVLENVKAGKPYVIRLKSPGVLGGRVKYKDVIKGDIEMDENITDVVILKTDGIPTYHFAHVVDDALMGTTHVIRSDEWVPSVPIHLQLFYVLGIKPPKYCHVSPIMKEEDGSKRKLSKRKDPEAAVSYFGSEGYPKEALLEYMLTLANSQYEDWRKQNKNADFSDYKVVISNMSKSGALFDLVKLQDVSCQVISRFSPEKLYCDLCAWAEEYDDGFAAELNLNKDRATAFFTIDRTGDKPRKDIKKWSDVKEYMDYIFCAEFKYEDIGNIKATVQGDIIESYIKVFDETLDKDGWFESVKSICAENGFSPDVKAYKAAPDQFLGHVGDVATVIRVALTGRKNTPDLSSIIKILGAEQCIERLREYADSLASRLD